MLFKKDFLKTIGTARVGQISLRNPPHENLTFGAIRCAIDALQNHYFL